MQENIGINSEATERLMADDENARKRILAIDLSRYDELVTYAAGVDWPKERGKILFLQTALQLAIPWSMIVPFTSPYFGSELWAPFNPIVAPIHLPSFITPVFDIARQTPAQWAAEADRAWRAFRDYAVSGLRDTTNRLIQKGYLISFIRPRRTSGVKGQAKSPIVPEKTAYLWAVQYFFHRELGEPLSWADLAAIELDFRNVRGTPPERARVKRKLAEQVKTNVLRVFRVLGLPEHGECQYPGS